jgi:exopolysaccharide biosynthesis protein
MVCRFLAAGLVALAFAAPAAALPRPLWPGVTYDTGVQFTPHGPVAISVLKGPRPGGATTLAPVLSNDALAGTETVTAMERRIAPSATAAGVNGDYFTFDTGAPSGIYMSDGQVASPPSGSRSSAGVLTDGTLDIRRVSFFGTWQAAGVKHTLTTLNEATPANGSALYTPAWGASTPAVPGSVAVILFPFPAAVPNIDLQAPVVEVRSDGAPVPIPIGGAVLVAQGAAAATLSAEAAVGALVTTQLIFKPDWPGVISAIGGGPQIVRDGVPVFRAGEAFTSSQLSPRAPRTGVGQLADGRIILVTVDGRQPGYSVGMTNFELAQTLVRLGAVTAMALDGGGSTSMAFDGSLLNRPSDGLERPVSTALMFLYSGVYVPPPVSVVSPNGDGVADRQSLRYKLVRPSTVDLTLTAPDGTIEYVASTALQPGTYDVPFPPPATPAPPPLVPVTARAPAGRATGPAQGRWQLSVATTDDVGQQSSMTQSFVVNSTLGFLSTRPKKLFLPPAGRDLRIVWRQAREARVVVTVETPAGEVVRTLATRRYGRSTPGVTWNGLSRDKKAVKGGKYVVRVVAKNDLGTIQLALDLRVQRIVGPKR